MKIINPSARRLQILIQSNTKTNRAKVVSVIHSFLGDFIAEKEKDKKIIIIFRKK